MGVIAVLTRQHTVKQVSLENKQLIWAGLHQVTPLSQWVRGLLLKDQSWTSIRRQVQHTTDLLYA